MSAETISLLAALVALLSAIYSSRAANEARKSNELSRLKAIIEIKNSYLDEMQKQILAAREWGGDGGYAQECRSAYAEAQIKYSEASTALNSFHEKIVQNKM